VQTAANVRVRLLFIVIPGVPLVQCGSLISTSDEDISLVEAISRSAALPVLYPGDEFVRLYTLQGKFPRGFSNSLPNTGHLNRDGNYAVGVALADYLAGVAR
jgi:hypothetical protein